MKNNINITTLVAGRIPQSARIKINNARIPWDHLSASAFLSGKGKYILKIDFSKHFMFAKTKHFLL